MKKQSNQVNFYERCQIQSIVFFNSYVNINVWITDLFGIKIIYLFIYFYNRLGFYFEKFVQPNKRAL